MFRKVRIYAIVILLCTILHPTDYLHSQTTGWRTGGAGQGTPVESIDNIPSQYTTEGKSMKVDKYYNDYQTPYGWVDMNDVVIGTVDFGVYRWRHIYYPSAAQPRFIEVQTDATKNAKLNSGADNNHRISVNQYGGNYAYQSFKIYSGAALKSTSQRAEDSGTYVLNLSSPQFTHKYTYSGSELSNIKVVGKTEIMICSEAVLNRYGETIEDDIGSGEDLVQTKIGGSEYIFERTLTTSIVLTGVTTISAPVVSSVSGPISVGSGVSNTWSASVTSGGFDSFTYQWKRATTENGTYTAISGATSSTLNTSFTSDVWIKLVVTDAANVTAESAKLNVTILSAPTGFQCTNPTSWGNPPQFSWNAVAGATEYHIYWKTPGESTYSYHGTSYTNSWTEDFFGIELYSGGDTVYYGVKALSSGGTSGLSNTTSVSLDGVPDKAAGEPSPKDFMLSQNYPNPFNPVTEIRYNLPAASSVKLTVYNMLGQEIAKLVDGQKSAGYHSAKWDASNVPSGTYFYRITAGSYTALKRMVVIK